MKLDAQRVHRSAGSGLRFAGLGLLALVGLAALSAIRMLILYRWRGVQVGPLELLQSGMLDWLVWVPFLAFVWWAAGRWPVTGPWPVVVSRTLLHLAGSSVCSVLQATTFAIVSRGLREQPGDWDQALSSALLVKFHAGALVYWTVLLCRQWFAARENARAAELARARLDEQLARARLEVLQAHLRPHFLFNTLNTVAALMRRDADAAETMLARLGDLLRRSLAETRAGDVPLEEELDFLERYLSIERARLGDRLEVSIDATPEARALRVPPLLLQPIVENAVLHGVAIHAAGGSVTVKARVVPGQLVLEVDDAPREVGSGGARRPRDPAGMPGIGLAGTREALRLRYGASAALDVIGRPGAGTRVVLRLPAPARRDVRAPLEATAWSAT